MGGAITAFCAKFENLDESRIVADGEVHRYLNVYVNDDDQRFIGGLATKLADGDILDIIPAITGG